MSANKHRSATKTIILFLALWLVLMYFFASDEISRYRKDALIAQAPGYALAIVDEVVKTGSNQLTSYHVRFKFKVNGNEHQVRTTSTDQKGAAEYVSEADTQAVYYTKDPAINTLKRYYDLRHTRGPLWQALILEGVSVTILALPIALAWSWRAGWLGRRKVNEHMR